MVVQVKKVIIPVAGLGTRMLPASKSIPKEMIPVVDRPAIQYVVDEAIAAGITEIILVTSGAKAAIENYFDIDAELDALLESKGKSALAEQMRSIVPPSVTVVSVRQGRPLGLGHAVHQAAALVGDEPFAVILPDVLVDQRDGAPLDLARMIKRFEATGASQIMVEAVPQERVSQYGIVSLADQIPAAGESAPMTGVVEKPAPEYAPSNLSVVGRYVLPARTMALLANTAPGAGGEIQLTDAIASLIREQTVEAYVMTGLTFDCGSKEGYVKAFIHYASKNKELAEQVKGLS